MCDYLVKKDEVKSFLEKISEEFKVPMPNWRFLPIKQTIEEPVPNLKIITTDYKSCLIAIEDTDCHMLYIGLSRRGVRRTYLVHEFFHYVDWIYGFNWKQFKDNEASVNRRTRKWLKNNHSSLPLPKSK